MVKVPDIQLLFILKLTNDRTLGPFLLKIASSAKKELTYLYGTMQKFFDLTTRVFVLDLKYTVNKRTYKFTQRIHAICFY